MRFSSDELRQLLRAWLVISLAFGILQSGGLGFDSRFFTVVAISAVTVGLGFLLHELAHKFVAQRYGCWAEFRAFDHMLVLALVMSFFGFILAAPGAVFIQGRVNLARNGRISAAGPATNIVLALLFLAAMFAFRQPLVQLVASIGFTINTWLGLFNMIPFGFFDGAKIWAWNKAVWLAMLALFLALFSIPAIPQTF